MIYSQSACAWSPGSTTTQHTAGTLPSLMPSAGPVPHAIAHHLAKASNALLVRQRIVDACFTTSYILIFILFCMDGGPGEDLQRCTSSPSKNTFMEKLDPVMSDIEQLIKRFCPMYFWTTRFFNALYF